MTPAARRGVRMDTMQTRGERNNNPGNIDYVPKIHWLGQTGVELEGRFATFSDPVYGLRAIGKLLLHYVAEGVPSTVRGLISRYAPSSENATDAYVTAVAAWVSVQPDDSLDLQDLATLTKLIGAIVREENGCSIYDVGLLARAAALACVA